MKVYYYFLLFSIFVAVFGHSSVYSQDHKEKKISSKGFAFGTGYSHYRILDKQVSPLIYKAHLFPVLFEYINETENAIWNIHLKVENGFIKTNRFSTRELNYTLPDNEGVLQDKTYTLDNDYIFQDELDFLYVWKLKKISKEAIQYYTGGQIKQFFYISFPTVPIFVQSELSLNPSILVKYKMRRIYTQSFLSFYVAGVITRLPYSNNPTDGKHNYFISTVLMGSEFMTVKDFQRINFQQSFVYNLNTKWSAGFDYNFYWYSCCKNKGVKAYDNTVTLKFIRKINSDGN